MKDPFLLKEVRHELLDELQQNWKNFRLESLMVKIKRATPQEIWIRPYSYFMRKSPDRERCPLAREKSGVKLLCRREREREEGGAQKRKKKRDYMRALRPKR